MIIQHFKLNILPVQNESGSYILEGLLYFEQGIIFILSRAETCKIETSENSTQ